MKKPVSCFELKSSYVEIIDGAERELCIMMAYFAPDKDILSAIKRAVHRCVHVRILIPRNANFMDDMNRLTVSKLLRYSGSHSRKLEIYMTENMLHSKLLMSERCIIIGSCNINRKSFTKLDELAISVDNDDSPFAEEVRSSVGKSFRNAESVSTRGRISYHPILAALEAAVM